MKNDPEYNIRFVKLIQQFPLIYNHTLNSYYNKHEVDKTWKDIATLLNEPTIDCITKWTTLRSKYAQFLRLSQANNPNAIKSKYYYLSKAMDFVLPFMNRKMPSTTVSEHRKTEGKKTTKVESHSLPEEVGSYDSITYFKTNGRKKSTKQCLNPKVVKKINMEFQRNGDLSFFKSLLPLLEKMDDSGRIRFRISVMQVLQDIQKIGSSVQRIIELQNPGEPVMMRTISS